MGKPVTLSLVFIFCLSNVFGQDWIQVGSDIEGDGPDEWFGKSVSISSDGNTVAIGAPNYYQTGRGKVRMFTWSGSAWTQKGSVIHGEADEDRCGEGVSLSSDGNTVAIGAVQNDGNGRWSGHVRVFNWSGSAWTQKGSDIDGEAAWDHFGEGVSLSSDGNTVAIGAPFSDVHGNGSGQVKVFSWSDTAWIQKGWDFNGETGGNDYGRSVSISSDGNTVAIGGPGNVANQVRSGHVRVFTWTDSALIQKGSDIDGEKEMEGFGWSVSLSSNGNILAVGAPWNDANGNDAGQVRVFTWNGSTWIKKGVDIDGEAAKDQSGFSLSVSSNGNTVAIGANLNDGNGKDAGHVRVFNWSGSAWTQKGSDIDGEAAGDNFGRSVRISSGGNSIAVGAELNDGNGQEAGHVRVFRYGTLSEISNDTITSAKIYPNPSTNNFNLNLGQSYQGIELRITDVLGQIVSTKKVASASKVDFEITGNKGVYLVEISTSDGFLTTVKVIKE